MFSMPGFRSAYKAWASTAALVTQFVATWAIEDWILPDGVQSDMGHVSVETTVLYYPAQEKQRKREIKRAALTFSDMRHSTFQRL